MNMSSVSLTETYEMAHFLFTRVAKKNAFRIVDLEVLKEYFFVDKKLSYMIT